VLWEKLGVFGKQCQETMPRTLHQRDDGGGSVLTNHRGGGGISVTVTRLNIFI